MEALVGMVAALTENVKVIAEAGARGPLSGDPGGSRGQRHPYQTPAHEKELSRSSGQYLAGLFGTPVGRRKVNADEEEDGRERRISETLK